MGGPLRWGRAQPRAFRGGRGERGGRDAARQGDHGAGAGHHAKLAHGLIESAIGVAPVMIGPATCVPLKL